ncbi:hypothetical protein ABID42_002438 [Arcicella rosea]|uniref:hypothetical protein n=1 Tax=Arcicella rosea TaxID=502909 RepID=UPI00345CC1E9
MKYLGYSILLIFFVSLFDACNNPLEDVTIKIKDALTESAINLTYRNAVSSDTTMIPKSIKFAFLGEDAEGIVSSVGNKKINISREGLLGIAIAPDYTKRPANIKVVAQLEGYLTDINLVTVQAKTNINRTIRMFKINNLPSGMSVDLKNIDDKDIASQGVNLTTNGQKEKVSLVSNSGINVLDKSGTVLTGKLELLLSHFENKAREFVPSNYTVYQAIGLDNKILPPFEFQSYGFFSIKIINDKFEEANNLSKPCSVNIEINEDSYHTNGTRLKEGESIPFWVYANNTWKMLANPVLKRNTNGKLSISTSISSLSYYALGEMFPVCEKGPVLVVNSANKGLDIYHYSRLIEKSSGKSVGDVYLSLNNGARYSLAGRRKNTVYLQVFNFNNQYGGDLTKPIFQTEAFDLCEEKTIPVNIATPSPQPINVELIIECAKGQVVNNATVPAKVDIQFQPKGASDWRDLMTLTRNQLKGSTYKLKYGSTYSIRASPNPAQGWLFYKRDTLINTTNYRFYIENKDYCK